MVAINAPLTGTLVKVAAVGTVVSAKGMVAVIESMKMEYVVSTETDIVVDEVHVVAGEPVDAGVHLVTGSLTDAVVQETLQAAEADRHSLIEVRKRHDLGHDDARPEAVKKRHGRGRRTARENLDDLVDADSFIEYGPLAIAAQRSRRDVAELIERTPADGLVGGVGEVDGARCVVASYDYMVLAGTQGMVNHRKKDRLFELAERMSLPVVLFTEGGGGRPGDTDGLGIAGLDCWAFTYWGALSGLVPMVGINSGYCFAGNAAILGCCDVIIATRDSNIGMAGPAMIEGGGLGVYHPTEIGPIDVQLGNGVVDIVVEDEAEGVSVAKQWLSYFQGRVDDWVAPEAEELRQVVPENRVRVYEIRDAIAGICDIDSVLEVREHWALGMVTAFGRIEGRPVGVIANNPKHLGGAIDADAADKAARFMQLCDAHDIPLLFLCDTPGFMVGPESEEAGMVRKAGRLFNIGSSVSVPFFTIITRKGYGLGAQAMAGGSFKKPLFTVAWPTGEIGGMGLEGAVRLGYRKELEAVEDAEEREVLFQQMVDRMYEHGKALSAASHFEIDDVIDPADSRRWIMSALRSAPAAAPRTGKKRPNVDTW